MKRGFDLVMALLGLVLLSPLFVLAALAIKLDSQGPVFFKQERVGKDFRRFSIYKFRTMAPDAPLRGSAITVGNDPRITRIGRFLRKAKIDELPQLINVLRGEMSFVGPRPELPQFVEIFRKDYEEILQARPGITDVASLKYRDEAAALAKSSNPDDDYVKRILPDKIRMGKDYIRQSSFWFDLALIGKTVCKLLVYKQ